MCLTCFGSSCFIQSGRRVFKEKIILGSSGSNEIELAMSSTCFTISRFTFEFVFLKLGLVLQPLLDLSFLVFLFLPGLTKFSVDNQLSDLSACKMTSLIVYTGTAELNSSTGLCGDRLCSGDLQGLLAINCSTVEDSLLQYFCGEALIGLYLIDFWGEHSSVSMCSLYSPRKPSF